MAEIILQHTSPITGDTLVYDDDTVMTNGELNTQAIITHGDDGIVRVDLDGDGTDEINAETGIDEQYDMEGMNVLP